MKGYGAFLAAMLRIGCIGFGGGSALIPVIEKEAVGPGKFIGREAYEKQVVAASITPGALPVELAGGIGWKRYGLGGLLAGAAAMALPGALLTVLCVALLGRFSAELLRQVSFLSVGIVAFILMLLLEYVQRVLRSAETAGTLRKELFVVAAVFFLTGGRKAAALLGWDAPLVGVSTLQVFVMVFFAVFFTRGRFTRRNWCIVGTLCALYVLTAGKQAWIASAFVRHAVEGAMLALGVWGFWRSERADGAGVTRAALASGAKVLLCLLVLAGPLCLWLSGGASFMARGVLSSFLSFGGGDAYLTIADALFVEGGVLSGAVFYGQLVPIVNVLPGSILCKTLTGIGYFAGSAQGTGAALGFAALGFLCSVGASCAVFVSALRAYEQLEALVLDVYKRQVEFLLDLCEVRLGECAYRFFSAG